MAKAIDAKNLNIYYGSFLAVEGVNMDIKPKTVTALIGPSGCGKSTYLRSINRMHEVIPGARVEGKLELDGKNLYGPGVDPVGVRRQIGMVFQRPNPFPTMSIYDNVIAGHAAEQQEDEQVRHRRAGRAVAARRQPVERGQGPARQAGLRPVRRAAAAAVHRPGHRRAARRAADGRALLGAGPDLDAGHRGPDQRAEDRLHDRHRHAQHAAGRPGQRLHRVLQHRGHRQAGQAGRDGRDEDDLLAARGRRPPRTTSPAASAEPRSRRAQRSARTPVSPAGSAR